MSSWPHPPLSQSSCWDVFRTCIISYNAGYPRISDTIYFWITFHFYITKNEMHFHKCDACSLLSFILGKKIIQRNDIFDKNVSPRTFLVGKIENFLSESQFTGFGQVLWFIRILNGTRYSGTLCISLIYNELKFLKVELTFDKYWVFSSYAEDFLL